jgi:hypothetical protein
MDSTMAVQKQQKIAFGADYPKRPPFFALRFMAYAARSGIAHDIDPAGLAFLFVVALTEDRVRYRKPPRFWRDSLCELVGVNRNRLTDLRKRLVDAGWLHYERRPGKRSGVYWVTCPGGDSVIDDSVLGDNSLCHEFVTSTVTSAVTSAVTPAVTSAVTPTVTHSSCSLNLNPHPHLCEQKSGRVGGKDLKTEETPPDGGTTNRNRNAADDESSVAQKAADDESSPMTERTLAERVNRCGVAYAVECVQAGLKQLVTDDESHEHALQRLSEHIFHFEAHRGAWGPVILYKRLTSPSLPLLAPSDGWPPKLPAYAKAEADAAAAAQRLKEQQQREADAAKAQQTKLSDREQLEQLTLEFGAQVDALTKQDAIAFLTNRNTFLADLCRKKGIDPRQEKSSRRELLKGFAEMAGAN